MNELRAELGRDLLGGALIFTASICLALLVNQLRNLPLPLVYQSKEQRMEQSVKKLSEGKSREAGVSVAAVDLPGEISLDQMSDLVDEKKVLVLDARPEIFHRLGHIPGALSLPRDDFENGYKSLQSRLEGDLRQPIVVYCSSASCEDSKLVKDSLAQLGYQRVSIFPGGWSEWTGAGRAEEVTQ